MRPPKTARHTAEDYWNLPESQRAELIDGELWDLASLSRKHQWILGRLSVLFANHIASVGKTCQVYQAPFAVNLFADNSTLVEPDLSVICDRSKLSDLGCEGAPDLIVEVVSPNNPSMDYVTKLGLYKEAGVREYWICDPQKERTHVYRFDGDCVPTIYPFAVPVPAGVLEGLEVCLANIVAEL